MSCLHLYAGSKDAEVKNLLLPEEEQHASWFEVTSATFVHYNIIFMWHCLKMSSPGLTFYAFCTCLATLWGVKSRHAVGETPALNKIPNKSQIRATASSSNEGNRHILSEKRFAQALVKSAVCMMINDRCPDHKCAPISLFLLPRSVSLSIMLDLWHMHRLIS